MKRFKNNNGVILTIKISERKLLFIKGMINLLNLQLVNSSKIIVKFLNLLALLPLPTIETELE